MKMGRERGVLRWDIRVSLLEQQIEQTKVELARLRPDGVAATAEHRQRAEQLTKRLHDLHHQVQTLGPSPRAKMG